jgi:hypothetical protein
MHEQECFRDRDFGIRTKPHIPSFAVNHVSKNPRSATAWSDLQVQPACNAMATYLAERGNLIRPYLEVLPDGVFLCTSHDRLLFSGVSFDS